MCNFTSNCGYFYLLCVYHKNKIINANNELIQIINKKSYLTIDKYLKKLNIIYSEILENNKFWNKFIVIFYFIYILIICLTLYQIFFVDISIIINILFCYNVIFLIITMFIVMISASSIYSEIKLTYKLLNKFIINCGHIRLKLKLKVIFLKFYIIIKYSIIIIF